MLTSLILGALSITKHFYLASAVVLILLMIDLTVKCQSAAGQK